MSKNNFLPSSLSLLNTITGKTHNEQISEVAKTIWEKHLKKENPVWEFVTAHPFAIDEKAHVLAMIDKRLPTIGLVGFFGCTTVAAGAEVLKRAGNFLNKKYGVKNVYGPINGTITRDYRLNLSDDFSFPGEPVNPVWYSDAFQDAGFTIFNRYVSGIAKHYQFFIKFLTVRKPSKEYAHLQIRPSSETNQLPDLKIYHNLMNTIFPTNSIYCPVLSWKERVYNLGDNKPVFDPNYTFFLEDNNKAVGFIVSFPYNDMLIVKTLGILPEYRGKHLSSLLIKKVHDQAHKDGLTKAVYATIRVGNTVYAMKRPGVKIYRRYVTMVKSF